ncbi:MAG TPA: translocation/assembly module TamB domain-containing protein [Candidatus Sulfopaludibacter sp.]|nr:translocation/assembly module TamB domain-containing protein [Candidatus Sulfopaludibacter sp.]
MSGKRLVWKSALWLTGLAAVAALTLVMVLQSSWFYNKVRQRIVTEAEKATGGRVELGSFTFDWRQMRAEAGPFVLHGREPADKPPLARASKVAVGLTLVSVVRRDVDVSYVEVTEPHVYLIVNRDGSTNLPSPGKPNPASRPLDPLFRLAASRFDVRRGIFELEARGSTPFEAHGQNLDLALYYDAKTPQYRGTLAMRPLLVQAPGFAPTPFDVAMTLGVEHDRIGIQSATLSTGLTKLQFTGAIENLKLPHGNIQYQVSAAVADASRALGIKLLDRGTVLSKGAVDWRGGSDYEVTGDLHATGVEYRGAYVQLLNSRAAGTLSLDPRRLELRGLHFSTSVGGPGKCTGSTWPCPTALSGTVATAEVRGRDLDLRGLYVALLGGTFSGQGRLENLERFSVTGEVSGVEARRAVALYSTAALPWNGLIFGKAHAEGLLQRSNELRASVDVTMTPAAEGLPARGQITAAYDTRGGRIDVGNATLDLPSSRAQISGTVGQRLAVRMETSDLNDFLPVLGQSAAQLPVKLENGSAAFDGAVTGSLEQPQVSGHFSATHAVYADQKVDAIQVDLDAQADMLHLRNGTLTRAGMQGSFQGAVALHQWKPEESSLIDGSGSLRNAAVKDLAAVITTKPIPASGTVSATAEFNGTLGNPVIAADVNVARGDFEDEPFDLFTGHVRYTERQVAVTHGELRAGAKSAQLTATFDHAPRVFDAGRLQFQANTNAMPVEQIHAVAASRPGVRGTLEVRANGVVTVAPAKQGEIGIQVSDIHSEVAGRGLQLTGQPLGDLHLTVDSQGQELHALLDSAAAISTIHGEGTWRLDGDYPGSATVTFSRVYFAALRNWIAPSQAAEPLPFAGFVEGQLHISGPLLKPQSDQAELRIPTVEITEAATMPRPAGAAAALTLRNSGPIVATLANSVLTVNSAHLVGHDTDLTVTGKVSLLEKTPLDLRVNGRVDLAIVREINRDFESSGTVSADATVRGTLDAPQINGKVSFQNATFQVVDLPNGISNANGVLLFTKDRATIQSFTGETGGGKIALFGFAAYGGGPLVFRIHANATEVRLRYPEGVSTVANAALNFTGSSDRSMLAGTVTVLRTGFNPQSDFSSIIAASAQPVRTPSARSGILGGMNFDIQIQTAPDIQVQSTLTEDIEMEANLRLRGTFSNPAVLGRVNITQGQIVFFGTKYTINQGSIAFYNPVRVEPVLNMDLETKARGIDVTLTVSGPLGKLNLTPRSDPPLQFNEIVALLATGRTPTGDPTLLAQQATAPQSWQQIGASALLGQAIASPVAGRLQRFFGVSRLRIDPSLPGVESNPQARVTLEQQVTPEITFTYITNVTNSNPQVVRVEWAFAKKWSVVALREENGMFGIDFFYKKRF